MTINQILYFRTIAWYENYHKAAEKLFISQPSLSRSIASLEEELGVILFEKKGRGIGLTKAGKLFFDYAEDILSKCEAAKNKMGEIASGKGCIDIGYIFPLASHYIPHKVRCFLNQENSSKISFNMYQNHTPAIISKVKSGELDVGFGSYMKDEPDLEFYPLIRQKMVLITPKEHELNSQEKVSVMELVNYPVIGYDKESSLGRYTKSLYRKLNMYPDFAAECPDEYSIMALVREGFGIALVPDFDVIDPEKVFIHQLIDFEDENENYMFWLRDRYQMPVVKSFIKFMMEQADIEL